MRAFDDLCWMYENPDPLLRWYVVNKAGGLFRTIEAAQSVEFLQAVCACEKDRKVREAAQNALLSGRFTDSSFTSGRVQVSWVDETIDSVTTRQVSKARGFDDFNVLVKSAMHLLSPCQKTMIDLLNDPATGNNTILAGIEALGWYSNADSLDALRRFSSNDACSAAVAASLANIGSADALHIIEVQIQRARGRPVLARILGNLGRFDNEEAYRILVGELGRADDASLPAIAGALGQFRKPGCEAILIELLKEPDPYVRLAALESLAECGTFASIESLSKSYSSEKHWLIRRAAVSAVGHAGNQYAVDCLAKALEDEHPLVRSQAVESLVRLGLSGDELFKMVFPLWGDADVSVFQNVLLALAPIDSDKSFEGILNLLRHRQSQARAAAAYCLSYIQNEQSLAILRKLLHNDSSRLVVSQATKALSNYQGEDGLNVLLPLLSHPIADVRKVASRVLRLFAGDHALLIFNKIKSRLDDEFDRQVRSALVETLSLVTTPDQHLILAELIDENTPDVAEAALRGIDALDSIDTVASLIPQLSSSSPEIRAGVLLTLWHQGELQVTETICEDLKSEDTSRMTAAVRALAMIGESFSDLIGETNEKYPILVSALTDNARSNSYLMYQTRAATMKLVISDTGEEITPACVRKAEFKTGPFIKAMECLGSGSQEQAREQLLKMADDGSAFVNSMLVLVALCQKAGKNESVARYFCKATSLAIDVLSELDELLIQCLRLDDDKVSSRVVRQLKQLLPEMHSIHKRTAFLNLLMFNNEAALRHALLALLVSPLDPDIRSILVRSAEQLGCRDISRFVRTGSIDRSSFELRLLHALQLLYSDHAKDTLSEIRALQSEKENDERIRYLHYKALIRSRRINAGVEELTKLCMQEIGFINPLLELSELQDEAIGLRTWSRAFHAALKLLRSQKELFLLCIKEGRKEASPHFIIHFRQQIYRMEEIHRRAGAIYFGARTYEEAFLHNYYAHISKPNSATVNLRLARSAAATGRAELARDILTEIINAASNCNAADENRRVIRRTALSSLAGLPQNEQTCAFIRTLAEKDDDSLLKQAARGYVELWDAVAAGRNEDGFAPTREQQSKLKLARKAINGEDVEISSLLQSLQGEREPSVIIELIRAVSRVSRDQEEIPWDTLQRFLRHKDPLVRLHTMDAMKYIGNDLVWTIIVPLLHDCDERVRRKAFEDLYIRNEARARELVEGLVFSGKPALKQAGIQLLEVIELPWVGEIKTRLKIDNQNISEANENSADRSEDTFSRQNLWNIWGFSGREKDDEEKEHSENLTLSSRFYRAIAKSVPIVCASLLALLAGGIVLKCCLLFFEPHGGSRWDARVHARSKRARDQERESPIIWTGMRKHREVVLVCRVLKIDKGILLLKRGRKKLLGEYTTEIDLTKVKPGALVKVGGYMTGERNLDTYGFVVQSLEVMNAGRRFTVARRRPQY